MTRKEALTDLLAKVEAGWPPDIDTPFMRPYIAAFGANWIAGHADSANRGYLDSAKALHEAVLPGWGWTITDRAADFLAKVWRYDRTDLLWDAAAAAPARAWLIAIIKAMIAKEDAA